MKYANDKYEYGDDVLREPSTPFFDAMHKRKKAPQFRVSQCPGWKSRCEGRCSDLGTARESLFCRLRILKQFEWPAVRCFKESFYISSSKPINASFLLVVSKSQEHAVQEKWGSFKPQAFQVRGSSAAMPPLYGCTSEAHQIIMGANMCLISR